MLSMQFATCIPACYSFKQLKELHNKNYYNVRDIIAALKSYPTIKIAICNYINMDTSNLSDMYALSPQVLVHMYQANHVCPCYNYYM